jgi:hypothetical protein
LTAIVLANLLAMDLLSHYLYTADPDALAVERKWVV